MVGWSASRSSVPVGSTIGRHSSSCRAQIRPLDRHRMQQKGDMYGMVAALAREGKVKPGRKSWVHKLRLSGPRALLWKDYFMQTRGMKYMVILMFVFAMFMNVLPALVGSGDLVDGVWSDLSGGISIGGGVHARFSGD